MFFNSRNSRRHTPMPIIHIQVQLHPRHTYIMSVGATYNPICHLGTLFDTGYMHFIIENVTGEHLPCCHNLITVCKNDTAVGAILNTKSEEGFSRQICTLSDNVVPAGEIAVSTTMCFNIILKENFTLEI